MPEAVNAPLLRVPVFVREMGRVLKKDNISRIFTATYVSAAWWGKLAQSSPGTAGPDSWSAPGLGLTQVSWCPSKIQGLDLPCGFLWGGPICLVCLWSQPSSFFSPRAKLPWGMWQEGCCGPHRGWALRKHSWSRLSLSQMVGAGGRWHLLPFHCLGRSFLGLILPSLILVLCNSITLVKLPPDLCWCEWMEYQPLNLLPKYDVTLFLDIIMCWLCNR